MKGKINTGIVISETESLVAGTEVEIVDIRYGCETYYMCIIPSGIRVPIEARVIDIIDHTPFMDWNKLRVEFASKAMQGMLSSIYKELMNYPEEYGYTAKVAVKYADALIEELQKVNTKKT